MTDPEVATLEGLRARKPLKTIAAELRVAVGTVSTYQRRAQRKLGAADRVTALSKWARRRRAYVSETSDVREALKRP